MANKLVAFTMQADVLGEEHRVELSEPCPKYNADGEATDEMVPGELTIRNVSPDKAQAILAALGEARHAVQPQKDPAAAKEKPAEEKPAKPAERASTRGKKEEPVKPAAKGESAPARAGKPKKDEPPPALDMPDGEDDEDDEQQDGEDDEQQDGEDDDDEDEGGILPPPPHLLEPKAKMRTVVEFLSERGYSTKKMLLDGCMKLRDHVPVLKAIPQENMSERLERALQVMHYSGE